jgi:hypothetical protein
MQPALTSRLVPGRTLPGTAQWMRKKYTSRKVLISLGIWLRYRPRPFQIRQRPYGPVAEPKYSRSAWDVE